MPLRPLLPALCLGFLLAAPLAAPAAVQTVRVPAPSQNMQGNSYSQGPSVSPDGRFVAFYSAASNLVPGDTIGATDVFLRDTLAETTRRVSVAADGGQANGSSHSPSVSADGRYVAFISTATNIAPGGGNGWPQVFVRDMWTETTERISVAPNGGLGDGASQSPVISADGRYVAFESGASNLAPDTNGARDVFLRDLAAGTTRLVSTAMDGGPANGDSQNPAISADGAWVAFESAASNLVTGDTNAASDVFIRDVAGGVTTRVSVAVGGLPANGGSHVPAISANGQLVAFASDASNLVNGDGNSSSDVFLCDLVKGKTQRVSIATDGAEGDDFSFSASISPDGRYVAFRSDATNFATSDTNTVGDIFLRDTVTNTTERVSLSSTGVQANEYSTRSAVGAGGAFVVFDSLASNLVPDDTNRATDVFVRDVAARTTRRISLGTRETQPNGSSSTPAMTPDARYVAFMSRASNLVADDTNQVGDVFLRDMTTGATRRISVASDGSEADGPSYDPAVSADGRYVAFWSEAANLVPGDTNRSPDVFVRDTQAGTTELVSMAMDGLAGNAASQLPSISANGRYVAFQSDASTLVPNDSNDAPDVFVRDRQTGTTVRVSVASDGTQGDFPSWRPSISADGRRVAFQSAATNLVPGDTNGSVDGSGNAHGLDVFLRDITARATTRVSVSSDGAQADDNSALPVLSADGRYVAFASPASNLVPADTDGRADTFVRDTVAGTTTRISVAVNGAPVGGDTIPTGISADGSFVALQSNAWNLVPNDTNGVPDVFVRSMALRTTERVSLAPDGAQGNALSETAALSADGRYVVFASAASNLVPNDTNGETDVFLRGPLAGIAPFTVVDAAMALRFAAGLAGATAGDLNRLNVYAGGPSGLDLQDAVGIVRQLAGTGA